MLRHECRICKKRCRVLHGKLRDLCRICYNHSEDVTIIPRGPSRFKEEITFTTTVNFGLTATQKKKLVKKLDEVYPDRKNSHYQLNKLGMYVRGLILKDVGAYE